MSAIAAAIGAAASIAGAGLSAYGAGKANQKSVDLAREMRRSDIEMWNKQNEYNSPAMQMQRLKEAGLNPNLIYGGGATHTAQQPPSAKVPEVQNTLASMAHVNLAPAISMYMDMQVKKAQIDNIQSQTKLNDERKITEVLNQGFKAISTQQGEQKLGVAKQLEKYTLQAADANVKKIQRAIDTQAFNEWIKREMLPFEKSNINSLMNLRDTENESKKLELNYQKGLRDAGLPIDTPWYLKLLFKSIVGDSKMKSFDEMRGWNSLK